MEDRYMKKYNLLLEKYMEIDTSNEKLQNRICHIRKQIRYLRRLKRLLIQKLVVYGDRFMDVCLEIPDMEPGANVEDQIIRRVAEVPHPPTPPHPPPAPPSRSSATHLTTSGSVGSASCSLNTAAAPAKKRRRTTVTQEDGGAGPLHSPMLGPNEPAPAAVLNRSTTSHRKSVTASSSATGALSHPQKNRQDPAESLQSMVSIAATTPTIPQLHVSASVEDVVNSVVFDCQKRQGKESESGTKDEPASADIIPSVASISTNVSEVFHLLPKTEETMAVDETPAANVINQQRSETVGQRVQEEPSHGAPSKDQV